MTYVKIEFFRKMKPPTDEPTWKVNFFELDYFEGIGLLLCFHYITLLNIILCYYNFASDVEYDDETHAYHDNNKNNTSI